jgi:Flp pilus assembly protein TadG
MIAYLRKRIGQIRGDQRGLSAVEFGAVAPFLGLLIVGVADLGRGYTERFALQQATNRTLEVAHTGTRMNNYSFLKAQAESAAGPGATATVTQWLQCGASTTQLPFGNTCPSGQQTARYVTLEIVRNFDPIFTSAGYPNVTAEGLVPLRARGTLRVQ